MLDYKNSNTIRIRDVADVFSGFAFKAEDLISEGIPVLKIANIQDKKVIKSTVSFYPIAKYKEKLSSYLYLQSDVLVAMTGEGSVGKFGKMLEVDKKYLVNQRVGILRPNIENIDSEYFYQVLTLPQYEEALYQLGLGAGQPNVSPKDIGSLYIPFPELQVQQRIASILSAYDDLIEVNNQRIKLLEETARELYKEWFVRMRFPGYKKAKFVKGVPNWEVITFGDIAFFIKGMNPKELFENFIEGHKLYVNIEAIEGGKVTYCNDKRTVDVNDDEVVMIMDGSRSGVVLKSKAGVLGSTLSVIRPKKGYEDFGSYIYYFLKQNFDWIESNNVGSAIPHANRKFIQKISLLKPPTELIKRFEAIAKPMEKQIEVLTQQNTLLRQIRDRLLPRLISGKLEVKDKIINDNI
jgi:type I restriction enzyme S subunit